MNGGLRSAVWVGFDGSGYIYVSDAGLDQVRVYAPGASGDAAPVRIIPLTGPGCALSVDKAGYVFATVLVDGFDCGARVMVYAPGAGLGPTVTLPIHTIVTTANEYLSDIVIDGAGELYIETAGEVWYYEDPDQPLAVSHQDHPRGKLRRVRPLSADSDRSEHRRPIFSGHSDQLSTFLVAGRPRLALVHHDITRSAQRLSGMQ